MIGRLTGNRSYLFRGFLGIFHGDYWVLLWITGTNYDLNIRKNLKQNPVCGYFLLENQHFPFQW